MAKTKKKCCAKFVKKGNHCSKCPVVNKEKEQNEIIEKKKVKKKKKKEG